jgi:hypothetical protein
MLNKFASTLPPNIVGTLVPTVPAVLKLAAPTLRRIEKPRLSAYAGTTIRQKALHKILHKSRFKIMLGAGRLPGI